MEANLPAFDAAGLAYVAVGGVGLSGVWDDLRVIGRYLGRETRAERLIFDMRTRMEALRIRQDRRPRVHWEWSAHPVVAGGRSWITELLDMAGADNRAPWDDYKNLLNELELYDPTLVERPRLVVANKMDEAVAEENLKKFKRKIRKTAVLPIAAAFDEGVDKFKKMIREAVEEAQ